MILSFMLAARRGSSQGRAFQKIRGRSSSEAKTRERIADCWIGEDNIRHRAGTAVEIDVRRVRRVLEIVAGYRPTDDHNEVHALRWGRSGSDAGRTPALTG